MTFIQNNSVVQEDPVVVFNVVGGLADMTLFAPVFDAGRTAAAWREFFARIVDAEVMDDNRDLVWAVSDLGYPVAYSSTFAEATRSDTLGWLAAHDFPDGDLLCRPDGDLSRAGQIKHRHCRAIPNHKSRLRAFVDNDPRVASFLRSRQLPGQTFDYLLTLGVRQIRDELGTSALRPCASLKVAS